MANAPFRSPDLYRSKGTDRININNLLAAVCVTVLTLLVTVSPNKGNFWSVLQLAIAIPCLISSSLCYAKFAYRPPTEMDSWDVAGWFTHSIGYVCVLNATAVLLEVAEYSSIAWMFIAVNVLLFIGYAFLDIKIERRRAGEKVRKATFYIVLMIVGAVLPLLFGFS